jgi:hypothetical protein
MLINLTDEVFGRLTVLRRGTKRDAKHTYWLVKCECGSKRKQVRGDSLLSGAIRSCGCIPRGYSAENIEGQRFGRLTAVRRVGSSRRRASMWECRCRCGRLTTARLDQLRDGTTQSCGCWYRDSRTLTIKHGHARARSHSPVYAAYQRERSLCECPTNRSFKYYGARGIRFLFDDFVSFLTEVGDKPAGNYWLMRRDADANFAPGELAWTEKKGKRSR